MLEAVKALRSAGYESGPGSVLKRCRVSLITAQTAIWRAKDHPYVFHKYIYQIFGLKQPTRLIFKNEGIGFSDVQCLSLKRVASWTTGPILEPYGKQLYILNFSG